MISSTSPTWPERWLEWRERNADPDLSKIGAFVLPDEPAWNDLDMESLHRIAGAIKTDYPSIPILVVETGGAIEKLIPNDDIDWLAFDEYGVPDPARDVEYQDKIALGKIAERIIR